MSAQATHTRLQETLRALRNLKSRVDIQCELKEKLRHCSLYPSTVPHCLLRKAEMLWGPEHRTKEQSLVKESRDTMTQLSGWGTTTRDIHREDVVVRICLAQGEALLGHMALLE